MKRPALLTVLILALTMTAASQHKAAIKLTLEGPVKPHAGIDAVYATFSDAYERLDAKMVSGLYTDDALYLTPESDIMRGRDVIFKSFSGFFDAIRRVGGKLDIRFNIVDRRVDQDIGYDVGIFSLTSIGKNGETQTSRGKFVVVAVRSKDGSWKFQLDSYSNLPKE